MNAQYFVYTRGHNIDNDYKLLFSPSNNFCPLEVRKYFLLQVRGLINLDTYMGNLENNPRWLLSKKDGYTLWGIGTMNKNLSPTNNTDYANRAVRGFFGLVIKGTDIQAVPFDLAAFERFYSERIADLWTAPKEDFKKKGVAVDSYFDNCKSIVATSSNLELNTDEERTVIWEDSISKEEFFAAALSQQGNFSCVYGLEEKSHAYNHDYRFYNVTVKGEKVKSEKTYKQKEQNRQEGEWKTRTDEDIVRPKKDYRLKLMILGAIATFIAVVLMVGRCSKSKQTNSQKSVSGDTVKAVKSIDQK